MAALRWPARWSRSTRSACGRFFAASCPVLSVVHRLFTARVEPFGDARARGVHVQRDPLEEGQGRRLDRGALDRRHGQASVRRSASASACRPRLRRLGVRSIPCPQADQRLVPRLPSPARRRGWRLDRASRSPDHAIDGLIALLHGPQQGIQSVQEGLRLGYPALG